MSGPIFAADERLRLRAALSRVAAEASRLRQPLFAAFRCPVPARDALDVFAAAAGEERFYFASPSRSVAIAAVGEVARIERSGCTRFAQAGAAARALFASLRSEPAAPGTPPEAGPLLVGGFAFADEPSPRGAFAGFPALAFVLPALAFARLGERAWCTLATPVAPDDDTEALAASLAARAEALLAVPARIEATPSEPPRFGAVADRSPDDYRRGAARALAAIAAGELEKVVLARACTVTRPAGFDAARVLATLRAAHPRCIAFGVGRGDACLVGATPERLLRREGGRVSSSALAGSAPRGRTPEEDARLAAALRESKKEQTEHAIVRRAIAAALAPVCDGLDVPEAPELLRLEGIQHLHTPIVGRLRAGAATDALALVERLHPTPAVSGAPRAAALAFLAARERLERGWYTGGIGWLAPGGDGEIAVALRCALLRGRRATLHAGAGIVEGSQPEAELAETGLKLRAVLGALVEL